MAYLTTRIGCDTDLIPAGKVFRMDARINQNQQKYDQNPKDITRRGGHYRFDDGRRGENLRTGPTRPARARRALTRASTIARARTVAKGRAAAGAATTAAKAKIPAKARAAAKPPD